jgi:hypothetical protein
MFFIAGLLLIAGPVHSAEITCSGIVATGLRESLILDRGHTCSIDTRGSGHDPLRPCNDGEECRVVGTFTRKFEHFGRTIYVIQTLSSVERAP